MTSRTRRELIAALLVAILSMVSLRPVAAQSHDQKILTDARNSYSLLKRQGLLEVKASVVPNWAAIFKNVPVRDRTKILRMASALRFTMLADATGNINVTHEMVGPKPKASPSQALDDIARGVDLSITGFLMTWAPFMLTYLIPENLDQFVLQELESKRILTFKQGAVEVSVTMSKDFEISELNTPQGSVRPVLKRDGDGFVLTGYDANNEDPLGGKVIVKARIELAPVQGMLLPKALFMSGSSRQTPINFEYHFINYRLKRRS